MGKLEERVSKLEELAQMHTEDWPGWSTDEQLLWVAFQLHEVRYFHQAHNPEHRYHATDRELLYAWWMAEILQAEIAGREVPPFQPDKYPIGEVPPMFVFYLVRFEPVSEQPERDQYLYEGRSHSKEYMLKWWTDWHIEDWTYEVDEGSTA